MSVPVGQMMAVLRHVAVQRLRGNDRYPLVLMLEPLFRCNLACGGCGKIQHPTEVLRSHLTPDQCFGYPPRTTIQFLVQGRPLIGDDEDRPVRRDIDVPYASEFALENPLLAGDCARSIASKPRDQFELERADKQVSLPFGEHRTLVDTKTGRRDRRIPVEQGLFVARGFRSDAEWGAGVVFPIADDRPAVVFPGLRSV